jgi:hypothetical protein
MIRPISKAEKGLQAETICGADGVTNWMEIAAGGALLAGGLLMLAGHRRSGTVAAASGVALTLIDQQEMVKSWWHQLPGYLDNIENMIDRAQETLEQAQGMMDNLTAKREKVRTMLQR